MTQTYLKGTTPSIHRIDLACKQAGFAPPPFDVHLKFLPSPAGGEGWTLLAHAAAGKTEILARWIKSQPGIDQVRIAPGIAPKLFRATCPALPPAWATVASFAKVHHLDLSAEGHAAWFIEGNQEQILAPVQHLETKPVPLAPNEIRCRPVSGDGRAAPLSRRQFEALSTAVALGYYEIPHRIDLRLLAARTGVSLGSVSELLRRAEGAILTHYIDNNLMGWPAMEDDALRTFRPLVNVMRQ